jgi:four helix bundle protein
MAIRTFRDLVAWQKAMELARLVYRVTQAMPSTEQFGLTNQMRRAAYSIPSNIAEGYARQSRPDYLKYLRISRGSLAELSTQMELATALGMIPPDRPVQLLLEETDRVIQFLIMSLERKTREESAAKTKTRSTPTT